MLLAPRTYGPLLRGGRGAWPTIDPPSTRAGPNDCRRAGGGALRRPDGTACPRAAHGAQRPSRHAAALGNGLPPLALEHSLAGACARARAKQPIVEPSSRARPRRGADGRTRPSPPRSPISRQPDPPNRPDAPTLSRGLLLQAQVAALDTNFDRFGAPLDVLWLDIEHTAGKRYFTLDTDTFPSPADLVHQLTPKGRRMVGIADPHLKADPAYALHATATTKRWLVRDAAGDDFVGECWPGDSSYLDLLQPAARAYWASLYADGCELPPTNGAAPPDAATAGRVTAAAAVDAEIGRASCRERV